MSVIPILLAAVVLAANITPQSPPGKTEGTLYTEDNVAIAYEHFKKGSDSVIIVCPGFYNSKDNRWMQKTVDLLVTDYDVIIFDFRGHGESGGKYTWSAREDMEVDAVIDYARSEGYRHIGILAFSLGAASAVNAVAGRNDVDSMVLVSCPSRFGTIDYHFWEPGMLDDLLDNIECKWEGKGARFSNIFMPKEKPVKNIASIKDTPILFIHGDRDWVVKKRHSKKLFEAATCPKKLVIIEKGLHAERLIQKHPERMKELIIGWFKETLK